MPVREKIFYPGGYYHVYSRGIEKRTIFESTADYRRFLGKAKLYGNKYSIEFVAYCLMPNHYHFLIYQKSDISVSVFLQRLNLSYSMYFNKRYERVGPLFQGRFKAKLIQADEYLIHLSRYIHLNPKEILNGSTLSSYEWSSYSFYIGLEPSDYLVSKNGGIVVLSYFSSKDRWKDYREFVESQQNDQRGIQGLTFEKDET